MMFLPFEKREIHSYKFVCEPFGEFAAMIKLLNCFTQLLMNDFALFAQEKVNPPLRRVRAGTSGWHGLADRA